MRRFPLRKHTRENNFLPLVTCFKVDVEGDSGILASTVPETLLPKEGVSLVFAEGLTTF